MPNEYKTHPTTFQLNVNKDQIDAGKSKDEIAKITEPKVEYTFEADGVLMKK